jgi:serine/threonine protein kinase
MTCTDAPPGLIALVAARQYQIVKKIGAGRTADVYLIESTRWQGSRFALKQVQFRPGLSVRFQEMPILCGLSHPNVINLYDYFEAENCGFLILEYCPGGSLMDLITQAGPLPREEFVSRCAEIAAGLEYCHSCGIAHGDIKPHNILIDGYNRCKLADFGLSQQIDPNTASTQFLGSMAFMAPEVLAHHAFDPFVADIWSLGITFFWMARGGSPFPLLDRQAFERIIQCGLPQQDWSAMQPRLFRLLRQMIEPNPDARISLKAVLQDKVLGVKEQAPSLVKKLLPTGDNRRMLGRSGSYELQRRALAPLPLGGDFGSGPLRKSGRRRPSQGSLAISTKNVQIWRPILPNMPVNFPNNATNVE